jgi:hypothetical protein
MKEAARMVINISNRLGLDKREEMPKRFRTKLGQMPEKDRKEIDRIIKESSSYEQAAFKIQLFFDISISSSAVKNYIKETGLR